MYYILRVDGVGECAIQNEDGTQCLFLFTTRETIGDFIEATKPPKGKKLCATPLDTDSLVLLLTDVRDDVQTIAIDPPTNCEFAPMTVDEFLASLHGP